MEVIARGTTVRGCTEQDDRRSFGWGVAAVGGEGECELVGGVGGDVGGGGGWGGGGSDGPRRVSSGARVSPLAIFPFYVAC